MILPTISSVSIFNLILFITHCVYVPKAKNKLIFEATARRHYKFIFYLSWFHLQSNSAKWSIFIPDIIHFHNPFQTSNTKSIQEFLISCLRNEALTSRLCIVFLKYIYHSFHIQLQYHNNTFGSSSIFPAFLWIIRNEDLCFHHVVMIWTIPLEKPIS